ncbi:MAG: type 1 glutamine amidotransferase [Chthoniobacterales bacterium]|nr:type 1 glutamine amidotransferase [Chthoniobacterales bacterium]
MNILLIQHDPLDGPGALLEWATSRGHSIVFCLISGGAPLPSLESVDFLVSLGGPMGAYEEDKHPWIVAEKEYMRHAVNAGKKILGLCLGCQLLADALGGKAFRHTCKEFGWQPIKPTVVGGEWFGTDDVFKAFQWHGDTYILPPGAVQLARNEAAEQQAFLMEGPNGNQVLGLQFHLEWTEQMAREALCEPDVAPPASSYVQSPKEILSDLSLFESAKNRFFLLLDRFTH